MATVHNIKGAAQAAAVWRPGALARNIRGSGRDDRLNGTDDADVIKGLGGDDRIDGDDGSDLLNGGAGDDRIEGDDGHDRIIGGSGNDRLEGDDGNDTINGGAGNDWIEGDDGNDTLTGGKGADTFVFGDDDDDFDIITDFSRQDTIRIEVDDDGRTTFDDLVLRNTNRGVVITLSDDDSGDDDLTVLLEGVRANQLDASQFMFVDDDSQVRVQQTEALPADLLAVLV